jgi:hypothetical protein
MCKKKFFGLYKFYSIFPLKPCPAYITAIVPQNPYPVSFLAAYALAACQVAYKKNACKPYPLRFLRP